jgi:hypothetical protein
MRSILITLALVSCAVAQEGTTHAVKGSVLDAVGLPGLMWSTTGTASPNEKGNVQSQTYFEQGAAIFSTWNNSVTLTPYASVGMAFDTKGFSWNNKIQPSIGFKVNKYIRSGVISAGMAYTYEDRFRNAQGFRAASGAKDFVQDWFGWDAVSEKKGRFPGETWAIAGHLSPVERGNLIEEANVTQGVIAKQFSNSALIPYAELTLGHDSKGFDWENKVIVGGGAKLGIPVGDLYTEIGAGYLRETRFNSGLSANAVNVFINFSYVWNLFGRQVR